MSNLKSILNSDYKSIIFHKEVHNFLHYYLFTIVNAAIGFISISYLTKHLLPEDYGMIGIFTSILFFVPSIMSFSANGLQAIEIVNLESAKYLIFRNNYISFVLFISILCFIVSGIVSLFLKEFSFVIIMASLLGFSQTLAAIHNIELIQHSKATRFGLIYSITTLVGLLLTILFISVFNLDWKSRVVALILAEFVILLFRFYTLSDIGKNFSFSFSKDQFKYFIYYGAPLMISILPSWIQTQSDRYFLLGYFSLKEVGLYAAAAGIGSFIAMINANMIKVVYPLIYKKLNEKVGKHLISKITFLYSILILSMTLVFCFAISLFGSLFLGQKFLSALKIIYIMCFTQAFNGIYMTTGLVIDYFKKTRLKTLLVFICAGSVLILSFILIPFIGIYGPAVASLVSAILSSILSLFFAKKLFIRYNIA